VYNFYNEIFAKKQAVCYNKYGTFCQKAVKIDTMEKVHNSYKNKKYLRQRFSLCLFFFYL